jgi:hypothetical protein
MNRSQMIVAAVAAVLSVVAAPAVASGFTCTLNGGAPGTPKGEETPPFEANGKEYKATAATIRDAAKEARKACIASEALGPQGCFLVGCEETQNG